MFRSIKFVSLLFLFIVQVSFATTTPTILEVKNKIITVNGRSKMVYTVEQPNGTWGYEGTKGQYFNVIVKNETKVPTVIHWHGLILPNNQDGVPGITQTPILPCSEYHYYYKLQQAGTYWMHSHMGLQIQDLMEAPFIINDPNDPYRSAQQAIIFFQDFTFQNPKAILKKLQAGTSMPSMNNNKMNKPDLNDVKYDAFLTNYHTLEQPEIIKTQAGKMVRLRFINGSASSNFWIHLGELTGKAIAFDGENIHPLTGKTFPLAVGQRIDVIVKIPMTGGAFPIFGQVEGTRQQTGLILVTSGAALPKLSETANNTAPPLNDEQERMMKSEHPLQQKPIKQIITLNLSGNMQKYIWMINGQAWPNVKPIQVKEGERIELIFNNESNMAHPMHLHGHVFELVGINQEKIHDGALHDTILVLPHTQVKVILDANYAGKWMLHCHMSYHQEAGMMTFVEIK